ncbi:MAG: hypothetical protein PF445_05895 [Melioribacteraceae bacterium]|jgi:hypothetical protein|nr:hypothetical protein [Melioribacteraceae bacterium]
MNLETRKIGLINWITQIFDEDIINQIDRIRTDESNWFADLPDNVQDDINESIAQVDRGEGIDHSVMVEKYKLLTDD